jgi:hypothetical protein
MEMRGLIALLIVLGGIAPAAASPNCIAISDSLDLDENGNPSELVTIENDTLRLRAAGYRPLWVERWMGCIKVTYREDGRLVVEYLHPNTLEPLF